MNHKWTTNEPWLNHDCTMIEPSMNHHWTMMEPWLNHGWVLNLAHFHTRTDFGLNFGRMAIFHLVHQKHVALPLNRLKKPKNSQNRPYVAVWETTFDASYKAVILTGYSSKLIFFDGVFILTARALLPCLRMPLDHPIWDFHGYMGTRLLQNVSKPGNFTTYVKNSFKIPRWISRSTLIWIFRWSSRFPEGRKITIIRQIQILVKNVIVGNA